MGSGLCWSFQNLKSCPRAPLIRPGHAYLMGLTFQSGLNCCRAGAQGWMFLPPSDLNMFTFCQALAHFRDSSKLPHPWLHPTPPPPPPSKFKLEAARRQAAKLELASQEEEQLGAVVL